MPGRQQALDGSPRIRGKAKPLRHTFAPDLRLEGLGDVTKRIPVDLPIIECAVPVEGTLVEHGFALLPESLAGGVILLHQGHEDAADFAEKSAKILVDAQRTGCL